MDVPDVSRVPPAGHGSNVYNAQLAQALAGSATASTSSARSRGRSRCPGWTPSATWEDGALRVEARREPARITVYRPRSARPAAGLRGRPLRGLRCPALPRSGGCRAGAPTWSATWPPCARWRRAARPGRGAGQPPRHGARRAGPRRPRALRGQGPRFRPGVHGRAAPAAVPALRARRAGAGGGRARGLAPHGRVAVGGAGRSGAAGADAAGAAGRRRAHVRAAPAGGGGGGPGRAGRAPARDRGGRGRRRLVRARRGGGRRRADRPGRAARAPGRVRGQADPGQGRRPAAGGVAAGAGRGARRPARRGRVRRRPGAARDAGGGAGRRGAASTPRACPTCGRSSITP